MARSRVTAVVNRRVGSGDSAPKIKKVFLNSTGAAGGLVCASPAFIDLTGFSLQIDAEAGDQIELDFEACFYQTQAANGYAYFRGMIGNRQVGPGKIVAQFAPGALVDYKTIHLFNPFIVEAGDVVSGKITVKIQWNVSSGSITMTTGVDNGPVLSLKNYGH